MKQTLTSNPFQAGDRVYLAVQLENDLTGSVLRSVGDRCYVQWDNAALDALATTLFSEVAIGWYDASELEYWTRPESATEVQL